MSENEKIEKTEEMQETEEQKAQEATDDKEQDYKQKYEELQNEYLRVFADFENVKKRLAREKSQALEYANESFARDLLPILDALYNALEAAKESSAIYDGINLVIDGFLKILGKYEICEISCDCEFDPNAHECIMQVSHADLENGAISQVLQRGYKYRTRILRPAMVSIVKN
ncbi:MAG: nucleotide exchange factor GrpE [Helicobacter sp.]|nr:nucleotide exchange factor GrpE [Helicobacter sp.]